MAALELLLLLVAVSCVLFLLFRFGTRRDRLAYGVGGATLTTIALLGAAELGARRAPESFVRTTPAAAGAVGSGTCRACHPGEHASWHRSFHRTMTQRATPENLRLGSEGARLEVEGRTVELFWRSPELFARLPDPEHVARSAREGARDPSASAPLVTRRVLLATGSHHHQVYWVEGERGNELRLVPVTHLLQENRVVPRRDAFLTPPDAPLPAVRWNSNCLQCHTTLGRPAHDRGTDAFASDAVELGIACEACHGAGAAHVARHRNPFIRYAAHLDRASDPTIVNPARLTPERSSEICGQCHAYFIPAQPDAWWEHGFTKHYAPGDSLERSRTLLDPGHFATGSGEHGTVRAAAEPESAFWGDGTMRVGGRELNALIASACYREGRGKRRIGCLSCHSLHQGDPDDQLRPGVSADAPCIDCHAEIAVAVGAHSRHRAGSSGQSCVNCHMPYTSYALLKAIRSHRIDSPSAARTLASGKPNACNLCHLDRSLAWTAETLSAWFGTPPLPATSDTESVARAVEELITGDAATRAVLAAAFGREGARIASGGDFQARYLAELLPDPYSAVRFMAGRSLASLPGFQDFRYDYLAPRDELLADKLRVIARVGPARRRDPGLLLDARGFVDQQQVAELSSRRDRRPVSISE